MCTGWFVAIVLWLIATGCIAIMGVAVMEGESPEQQAEMRFGVWVFTAGWPVIWPFLFWHVLRETSKHDQSD